MALPKANRLKSRQDFQAVFRGGTRRQSPNFTLRALRPRHRSSSKQEARGQGAGSKGELPPTNLNPTASVPLSESPENASIVSLQPTDRAKLPTKIGISISTKVSKRAVVRNRIKRKIAAALQQLLPEMPTGWRLVIVVKTIAAEQECVSQQFLQELKQLLVQAEVLNGYS
jgi:ribonuclease P protein component